MRIFASIAICLAALSGANDIRASQSSGASSQEASCSITGRVTIDNEAAPDVAVALRLAADRWPLPPAAARATTDKDGRFQMTNVAAGRYYLIPHRSRRRGIIGWKSDSSKRRIATERALAYASGPGRSRFGG